MKIDHVEIFVADQRAAAAWYSKHLGYEIVKEFEHWADTGPLMIQPAEEGPMLALFNGTPQGEQPTIGIRRVAFQTTAGNFAAFVKHAFENDEIKLADQPVQDHGLSVSCYFTDPYGNLLEVTTYEYEEASHLVTK